MHTQNSTTCIYSCHFHKVFIFLQILSPKAKKKKLNMNIFIQTLLAIPKKKLYEL